MRGIIAVHRLNRPSHPTSRAKAARAGIVYRIPATASTGPRNLRRRWMKMPNGSEIANPRLTASSVNHRCWRSASRISSVDRVTQSHQIQASFPPKITDRGP